MKGTGEPFFLVVNQPYLIRNNKTPLYLTRKVPGSVRRGIIQSHFPQLSQETWEDVRGYVLSVLMVLALLSQLDLIWFPV